MLYNIVTNQQLKSQYAIDSTESLSDLAFENGWRITQHAVHGVETTEYVRGKYDQIMASLVQARINGQRYTLLEPDQWNELIQMLHADDDIVLSVDKSSNMPYVEDVEDQLDEEDQWMLLEDPSETADEEVELAYDYVETFHHLNQQ